MSALDGWIDVCRTGTWRDASGRDVTVTSEFFDKLVSAFADDDPVPLVVGHPAIDAPAYGYVETLRRAGDRLQAKLRDIAPAFRAAVEAGTYAGRSIAIRGGKLRHVAWLGGKAPAVPGLAPTQFSDASYETVEFAAGDLPGGGTSQTSKQEPGSMGDEADEKKEQDLKDREIKLAADEAALKVREAEIEKDKDAAKRSADLAAANTALAGHVEAGRVLPAERAGLAALFVALPADEIEFASPKEGGDAEQVKKAPKDILEALLAALPKRVEYSEQAGGEIPGAGAGKMSNAAIAIEANALMASAAERGEVLTSVDAVDQVRAKHNIKEAG